MTGTALTALPATFHFGDSLRAPIDSGTRFIGEAEREENRVPPAVVSHSIIERMR